jgi:hypothetical protein
MEVGEKRDNAALAIDSDVAVEIGARQCRR